MSVTTIAFPEPLPVEPLRGTDWQLTCDGVTQKVTNLAKPYWGPEGYTKGDLLGYYFNAARWILPFLRDRALTLKRMPDGADGPFFYAKNAPDHVPDWVPRAPIRSEDGGGGRWGGASQEPGKVIEYLMAQDVSSLLYVANLGCIEMHPWHSRIDALGFPDYAFFDLDPFDVPYRVVKDVALVIKAALDQLGLVGYPRTSGASGLHVYVPIDRVHTFAEVRELITRICRLVNRADPDRTTMEWQIGDRTGKVFLDAGMNTEGRNIASAYSVRPHRGATVSTPLQWEELAGDVEPGDFTMASIWPRLEAVGDIFTAVLAGGQTLWSAMEAVGMDPQADRRGPSHTLEGTPPDPPREPDPPQEEEPGELDTYRRMRDFAATAEPAGTDVTPTPTRRFVIQHHLATRLHHDLRLERGGTLRSFALPKGLPLVPGLAHMVVPTEDHPLEYLTFSGDIPQGEYGGGQMRIWDTGTYEAVEWEEGKVTVRLHGHRHRGEWHLFRAGGDRAGWLVTRASGDTQPLPPPPPSIAPCLAATADAPFDDDGWLFEVKWDGVRAIATTSRPGTGPRERNEGRTALRSRAGNDITDGYPELHPLWERVLASNAVLDGEIVVMGPDGRPDFGLLQQRMHLRGTDRVAKVRQRIPATYVVFDLLAVDGQPLVDLPLTDRLALLDDVLVPGGRIVRSDVIPGAGTALFAAAEAQGLEGVMAKRASSTYQAGRRTRDWLKIKVRRRGQVVIGGWLGQRDGARDDLGSLLVGAHDDDGVLRWLGRVGTGFDAAERRRLQDLLAADAVPTSPFEGLPADQAGAAHVAPRHVALVEFGEVTADLRLRAPAYVRTVPDADPASCTLAGILRADERERTGRRTGPATP